MAVLGSEFIGISKDFYPHIPRRQDEEISIRKYLIEQFEDFLYISAENWAGVVEAREGDQQIVVGSQIES